MNPWDIENCPPNNDTWTDADEARAAGHPAYQPDDFEPYDLRKALAADAARCRR
jgi:hypothetical protein